MAGRRSLYSLFLLIKDRLCLDFAHLQWLLWVIIADHVVSLPDLKYISVLSLDNRICTLINEQSRDKVDP